MSAAPQESVSRPTWKRRVFGVLALLIMFAIAQWRFLLEDEKSGASEERRSSAQGAYAEHESLSRPPSGAPDRTAADSQKENSIRSGTDASSQQSPVSNQRRVGADLRNGVTIESEKETAQGVVDTTLTPADILSQKLDLNNPERRAEVVRQLKQIEDARKRDAWARAVRMGIPTQGVNSSGRRFELQYFENDKPIYHVTNNVNAAISTAANLVRGTVPFNVTGSSITIGLWEAAGDRIRARRDYRPAFRAAEELGHQKFWALFGFATVRRVRKNQRRAKKRSLARHFRAKFAYRCLSTEGRNCVRKV